MKKEFNHTRITIHLHAIFLYNMLCDPQFLAISARFNVGFYLDNFNF